MDEYTQDTAYHEPEEGYDDSLVDEFGRTLEEQIQDDVAWQHTIDYDQYRDQPPHDRLYVTYDGGPQYDVFEYFPHWHYDHTIEVLEDGYENIFPENWP